MDKLENKNYHESFKTLGYIDRKKLSLKFFKQSELRKLLIKSNAKRINLENQKPCLYCLKSFKKGYVYYNNFYCYECLQPASLEDATIIFINAISESENN